MRNCLTLIFILSVLVSCKQSEQKFQLEEYSLEDCLGETKSFLIPKGWVKTKSSNVYYHGFIEQVQYPDSSYVMILCAHQTEIAPDHNTLGNLFSRVARLNGTTIIYDGVPKEKKPLFDFAFDSMEN